MFDYSGAIHIHTEYSFDGNASMESVIKSAKQAGLDFIIVTDHFRMDARNAGWEGWHDGVLVLVGEEISPRYNHLLALGIKKPVIAWKKNSKPQEYIDEVNRQGGIGLIAHPDHTGAPKFGVKDYPWKDWSVKGYAAVSIWDLMTDWQEKLTSIGAAVKGFAFPSFVLSGPKKETLERWDAMNAAGRVAGFGEIDNHNTLKRYFGKDYRIFPFDLAFRTVRTHLLLGEQLNRDVDTARRQVMDAVSKCRLYVAQEREASAKGFMFRIFDADETASTGMDFKFKGRPAMLEAKIPKPGLIRVMRNGALLEEVRKASLNIDVNKPGVYRVEAYRKTVFGYKPWIYSNPIWIV